MENRNLCFIAKTDNKLIGHLWLSFNESVYVPEIERNWNFGTNSAYIYNTWVHPNFRNQSIAKNMLTQVLHHLKSNTAVEKTFASTRDKAARNVLLQFNFRPIKAVSYIRVFMFKRYKELLL